MAIKHNITLSTTEPNNEVGVIKIRQADEQTQILDVQITADGVPMSFVGYQPFFCAKLGQTAGLGIVEQKITGTMNPANGTLEYVMRQEDWQKVGRQIGYFAFRKMKNDHEWTEQFTTRDFTYNVIPSVTGEIREVKKDGSTYVWTIENMLRLFKEYIATGKVEWENYKNDERTIWENYRLAEKINWDDYKLREKNEWKNYKDDEKAVWEKFVEDNREFLETADPGGKIILELLGARGGAQTLGERLDGEKAEVSAQLAQTLKKGNVSVVDINKNLGKFDQTYMTDEFLQQMVGTTPINSIPADNSITQMKLADKAVVTTKTDFFTGGKNLFNKYAVTKGQRIDGNTGTLLSVQGVNTSELIDVLPSTSYYRSHTDAYAIYDINGVHISGGVSTSVNKVIAIPANGAKVRLSVKNENLDTFQFELGTSETEYEIYKGVLSSQVKVQSESLPPIPLSKVSFTETIALGKNLYDHSNRLIGKMLNGDGSTPINFNNGAYDTSDYIHGSPGGSITMSRESGSYMVVRAYEFYDKDKVFISGASQSSPYLPSTLTYPTNAMYVRVSHTADSVNYQIEKGTVATSYEKFVPKLIIDRNVLPDKTSTDDSPFSNKTLVTNGDSITYGTTGELPFDGGNYDNQVPWPQFVAETLKMGLSNHAIGGSAIAVKESSPTDRFPIVTRYQDMADGDIIIIAGGSNDWQYSWTPLGDMTSRTNYTFYGALHNLCLGLLEKYKGKQIVFTTPIKRAQTAQEAVNANGKTLSEYGDIIKEVCGYYGIPVIDMYNECTINPHIDTQRSEFIPDTVHPNRTGHELMAKRIGGYLRQLA